MISRPNTPTLFQPEKPKPERIVIVASGEMTARQMEIDEGQVFINSQRKPQ